MKNLLLSFCLLSILFVACKKDSEVKLAADYFPLQTGVQWCYDNTIGFGGGTGFTNKTSWQVKGDTVMGGATYSQLWKDDFPYKLIRQESGNYFKRKYYQTGSEELLFLKTTDPDGAQWEQEFPGIYSTVKYVFTQTLLPSFEIGGQTFNDVIEVKCLLYYTNPAGEPIIDPANASYYFANGIGLVYAHEPSPFQTFSELVYANETELILGSCE